MNNKRWIVCSLGITLVLGCSGSEIGNPPFQPEPNLPSGFNADEVEWVPDVMGGGRFTTLVRFSPSAFLGNVTDVQITNLDDLSPIIEATVTDGEEMEVRVPVEVGHELRFLGTNDGSRLAPLDLVAQDGVELTETVHALSDCLLLEGRDFVVPSEGLTIRVLNGCGEPVQLESPTLRLSSAAFGIEGGDVEVGVNQETEFQVTATGADDAGEDTLFITVSAPQMDRRAVTLRLSQ